MTTTTTPKMSATAKKYLAIINSGTIGEREIITMRSFMHKSKENARFIFDAMSDKELTLTAEQNNKGIEFLKSQRFTPNGKERKNNPFGYREEAILDGFTHFTLYSFYNAGNAYHDFYLPIYLCHGKDNAFEYYYNGKVNIVG